MSCSRQLAAQIVFMLAEQLAQPMGVNIDIGAATALLSRNGVGAMPARLAAVKMPLHEDDLNLRHDCICQ